MIYVMMVMVLCQGNMNLDFIALEQRAYYIQLSGVNEYYFLCLSSVSLTVPPTNEFPIQDKYLKSSICTYSSVSNMKLIVVTSLGLLFKQFLQIDIHNRYDIGNRKFSNCWPYISLVLLSLTRSEERATQKNTYIFI